MGDSNFVYEVSNRWGYVTVVLDNNAKKVFPFTNAVQLQVVFEDRQGEQNRKEERAVQSVSDRKGDVQNFSTCFDSNLMVTFDQPVVKQEIDEVEALFSYGALSPLNLIPVDAAITGNSHEQKGELSRLLSSYQDQSKSKNVAEGLNGAKSKELSGIFDKSNCVVDTEEAESARQNHDIFMFNRQGSNISNTGSSDFNSENISASGTDTISCPRRSTRRCQKSPYGNSDTVSKSIPELVGNDSVHAGSKMGKNSSKRKLVPGKNYKLHIQPSGLSRDCSKPGFFCCQLCNRLFKYKLSFQKHKAWHKQQKRKRKPKHSLQEFSGDISETTKSRIFRCEICYRFFKYKLSFQKHMAQHNKSKNLKEVRTPQNDVGESSDDISENNTEESGVFSCEICDRLFKYELSFEKHMSRHKEKEEKSHGVIQNCPNDISKNGNSEQSLKGHNLRPRSLNYSFIDSEEEDKEDEKDIPAKKIKKNSKKAITCGECNEVFRTKFKYKRHQRQVHGLDYNYPCIICGDTFKTLLLLKTHRKIQHNNRRCEYFCRVCGFVSGTRRDIKKHERTHGVLCNLCNETFHLSGHMTRHLREKHMDDVDENGVKLVKSCSLCIRVFLSEKRLQKHMSSHEGTKPNICFKCGCMFNTRSSLNTHIANHHNPTAPSHICCEICGARLSNKKTLAGHMIQVHGKKTYKCSYCPKAFVNANKLSIHVRTHTREKPFTCEVCGKGFCQRYNVTIHMRTHTQVKPFSCGLCGLTFAYKCSLQSHQRTKHHVVNDLPRNEPAKAEVVQIEEFEL